jgi:hypothetical protein
MANRVLLGKKGTEYGLWISKPGIDVTTANVSDLMFSSSDSNFKYGQVLAANSYTFPTTAGSTHSVTVTMPSGKEPYVFWYSLFSSSTTFNPVNSFEPLIEVSYSTSGSNTTVQFYKYGSAAQTIYYIVFSAELN